MCDELVAALRGRWPRDEENAAHGKGEARPEKSATECCGVVDPGALLSIGGHEPVFTGTVHCECRNAKPGAHYA